MRLPTSGLYGAIGTLAALQARQRTAGGQVADVSLLDAASSLTHSAIINYYQLGEVMKRNGNQIGILSGELFMKHPTEGLRSSMPVRTERLKTCAG